MYLAYKEMLHSKARYLLMILVIILVSYLIYFLSGLAFGLANNNRSAIDRWDANSVVISKYANNSLASSKLSQETLPSNLKTTTNRQPVAESMAVAANSGHNTNVTVLGINANGFLAPTLVSGHQPKRTHEIVVDESLLTNGLKQGSTVTLNGGDQHYKIVGVTKNNRFSTLPVIFMSIGNYQAFTGTPGQISGVVFKTAENSALGKGYQRLSISKLINKLPGYSAEVSTFELMIGSLFVIIAFIIGIFMYIMTIEKTQMYGVMRAQGISGGRIVRALLSQSLLIGLIGVGIGLMLNQLTVLVIPAAMPYYSSWLLVIAVAVILLAMVVLGAMVSIWRINRIDPLDAIGGDA